MQECKLTIDINEYVKKFKPDLIDVVYAWCNVKKNIILFYFIYISN